MIWPKLDIMHPARTFHFHKRLHQRNAPCSTTRFPYWSCSSLSMDKYFIYLIYLQWPNRNRDVTSYTDRCWQASPRLVRWNDKGSRMLRHGRCYGYAVTPRLVCNTLISSSTGNIFAVRPGKNPGPATFAGSHLDTQVRLQEWYTRRYIDVCNSPQVGVMMGYWVYMQVSRR